MTVTLKCLVLDHNGVRNFGDLTQSVREGLAMISNQQEDKHVAPLKKFLAPKSLQNSAEKLSCFLCWNCPFISENHYNQSIHSTTTKQPNGKMFETPFFMSLE